MIDLGCRTVYKSSTSYRKYFWIRLVPCDLPFQGWPSSDRVLNFERSKSLLLLTATTSPHHLTFGLAATFRLPHTDIGVIGVFGGVGSPLPHHPLQARTNH